MPEQVEPRIATPRDPARRTLGHRIAFAAKLLGTPLMPHQRRIVDTALELRPDGRPAYTDVIVTIPRQSGKTALCNALLVGRALSERDWRAWYTAQTGQAARLQFDELVQRLRGSRIGTAGLVKVRRSSGQESITIGTSRIAIFSPQPDALHGQAIDCVVIDEGWSFDRDRGAALLQAARPAGATRPRRQFWIVSTAGDATSEWFRQIVDDGRTAAADPASRTAYFEWSADPDTAADPAQMLAATIAAHPAAGRTIDPDYLAGEAATMPRGEFLRAYANTWTSASETVFPAEDWAAAARPADPPAAGPAVVAIDVAPSRGTAAVAVAWDIPDGPTAAIAAHGTGTDWVVPDAARLAQRLQARVALDDLGPAAGMIDPLRAAGARPLPLKSRDITNACAGLYDAVVQRTIGIVPDPALDAAAAAAVRRPVGDAWAWGRRRSAADITPLCALTWALWVHRRPIPEPIVV